MSMIFPGLPGLLFICSICIAQIPAANSTASVSGRVTIEDKGAAGITVVATVSAPVLGNRTVAKTVTDDEGNYHLTELAAGRLTITPIAGAFVTGSSGFYIQPGQTVNVAENESIMKIDFALVRGGVITGRITDLEGRPIIGERVNVLAGEGSSPEPTMDILPQSKNRTDDRGVYRIYGLSPGNYKVSVGQAASGASPLEILGMGGSQYTKTFYPGVAEAAKATAIEISAGTEVANINITPGKSAHGFSVSGRVIDADSSQPVAKAFVAYSSVSEENQSLDQMNFTGSQTDANGKFRLEGIQPGHYAAFTVGTGQENSYSDPAPFYISSGDVTEIEIKVRRGATIEGVAVIESNVDPAAAALLQSVTLIAYVADAKSTSAPSFSRAKVNPDGSFQLAGLAPGNAKIHMQGFPAPPKGLELVHTELHGLEQENGIEVTAGAHITGVRLGFTYGTGKIRGEVKIEGGESEDMTVTLSLRAVGGLPHQYSRTIEVDARGHFVAEDIPSGTYELTLAEWEVSRFEPVTLTITVANGAETPAKLMLKFAVKKDDPE